MYFTERLIESTFFSLRETDGTAKRGMERTSALMYFLAFDMTSKNAGFDTVDFSPEGRWRQNMAENYESLVFISRREDGSVWFVSNLGEIDRSGTRVLKNKIGSDFFTAPVKRASESNVPRDYPRRPPWPLLSLGNMIPGGRWGMSMHPDWQKNAPKFLVDRLTNEPWSALAIFVLRNEEIDSANGRIEVEQIVWALEQKFTPALSEFWKQRIMAEKFPHEDESLQEAHPYPFGDIN